MRKRESGVGLDEMSSSAETPTCLVGGSPAGTVTCMVPRVTWLAAAPAVVTTSTSERPVATCRCVTTNWSHEKLKGHLYQGEQAIREASSRHSTTALNRYSCGRPRPHGSHVLL